MTHNEKVLQYMQTFGSITPREAVNCLDVYRLSGRIFDLKKAGHDIKSTIESHTNADGEVKRYSRYYIGG